MENYISEIDTKRFGFKIVKINNFDIPPRVLIEKLRREQVKLIISKIDSDNIELINELEANQFLLKDIQLTYQYDLTKFSDPKFYHADKFQIRDAEVTDVEILKKIAGESFNNYGHYAADKRLDSNECSEIYTDWIYRSITEPLVSDKIIIAEFDNNVAGFLAFKCYKNYVAGVLGAVSADYRNKNAFYTINLAGLQWAHSMSYQWIEHNVLIDNFSVNRVYTKLGFSIKKSFVTMHCWI